MFKDLELIKIAEAEKLGKDERRFTSEGGSYLRVPGLKKLKGVRTIEQVIPLSLEIKYPTDNVSQKSETVELFKLAQLDGDAVLLRNIISNDGEWQPNVAFYIDGDWADSKAPEKENATPAKK